MVGSKEILLTSLLLPDQIQEMINYINYSIQVCRRPGVIDIVESSSGRTETLPSLSDNLGFCGQIGQGCFDF